MLTTEQLAAAYERHAPYILRYCRLRVGDAAEDVAADVWVTACRDAHRYEDRGYPVTAWLLRIAHNRCVDHIRRERRRPALPLLDCHAAPDALGACEAWADALPCLSAPHSAPQRYALMLAALGFGTETTAQALGVGTNAAKAVLHRARAAARGAGR